MIPLSWRIKLVEWSCLQFPGETLHQVGRPSAGSGDYTRTPAQILSFKVFVQASLSLWRMLTNSASPRFCVPSIAGSPTSIKVFQIWSGSVAGAEIRKHAFSLSLSPPLSPYTYPKVIRTNKTIKEKAEGQDAQQKTDFNSCTWSALGCFLMVQSKNREHTRIKACKLELYPK